jgi:hypothetical protein
MPLSQRHQELIVGLTQLKTRGIKGSEIASYIAEFDAKSSPNQEPLRCSTSTISQLRNNKLQMSHAKQARWIACIKQIFEKKGLNYQVLVEQSTFEAVWEEPIIQPPAAAKTLSIDFCGLFVGYYIDVTEKILCEAVFWIEPNGKTVGKSAQDYDYYGDFGLAFENHLFIGHFGYSQNSDSHRFTITCDKSDFKRNQFMDGVYSGKGERSNVPMLGRTRIYKEADYTPNIKADFENRIPEIYSLQYPNVMEDKHDAIQERVRDMLLLCTGKEHSGFGESLDFFEQIGMIPPVVDASLAWLKGSYITFRMAKDNTRIIGNVIRIFDRGYVEAKSSRDATIKYIGRAYLYGDTLYIFFFKKHYPATVGGIRAQNSPYYNFHTYKVGSGMIRSGIKHLYGLSMHTLFDDNALCAGYEVMLPLPEKTEGEAYHNTNSFLIPVDECSASEKAAYLSAYPPLIQFFEQHRKPIIIESRVRNSEAQGAYLNEKGNTYFAAACYNFYNGNYEVGIEYCKKAKKAGFKNFNLLEKELSKGLLSQLEMYEKNAINDILK